MKSAKYVTFTLSPLHFQVVAPASPFKPEFEIVGFPHLLEMYWVILKGTEFVCGIVVRCHQLVKCLSS